MKIRRTKNQTPESSPPSMADGGAAGDEYFVWEVLVPRLVHPSKLIFIQALLRHGGPLSLSDLAEAADISLEHARYQCKSMQTAGVLEVVSVGPRTSGEGDEPFYFFPKPPRASPSSPAAA
ncbi:MAG: winged helix-turn-helix domain-containing protein [Solirubrobacterales bacterium]